VATNDVSVIDTAAGMVVATIRVGEAPWGVAIGPALPVTAPVHTL
jgi:YVTN family beta-propeller protein